ncbi:MAG: hypothetical protein KKB51_19165 [Candidatus Riflebacteria bacterium]|nr:hypothetical protein [Candidatus Riflebacteria bacterium]
MLEQTGKKELRGAIPKRKKQEQQQIWQLGGHCKQVKLFNTCKTQSQQQACNQQTSGAVCQIVRIEKICISARN